MPKREIDLRAALNAISDVVQNRPRPLREFDQIYMKSGDMVLQSEFVAHWAHQKRLAFIGDGDAISVAVAYLKARDIIDYGPSEIVVFDFDERICNAVQRFADKAGMNTLRSTLYNCLDPFPALGKFDCFYTNPPWGATNKGESVKVFMQRGMEAMSYSGKGMVVIADNAEDWAKEVLGNVQQFGLSSGFYLEEMISHKHSYHLDDAPDLRSCNLLFNALPDNKGPSGSLRISDSTRLTHFYGRQKEPAIRYVRDKRPHDFGVASQDEYSLERFQ